MAKRNALVTIDKDRCKGCELCVSVCPEKVLAMSEEINSKGYFYARVVNQPACTACRFCAMMCPDVAIEIAVEEPAGRQEEEPVAGTSSPSAGKGD